MRHGLPAGVRIFYIIMIDIVKNNESRSGRPVFAEEPRSTLHTHT